MLVDYSYEPEFFNISNWSKIFEHLANLFLQYTECNNFSKFFSINNFSLDYTGLNINWPNTYLSIIPGTLPSLKLLIKSHPFLGSYIFLMYF